ncbi:MAG: hypothetical protein LAKADJCE_00787 [Candidatus Argoarchaeum ethanivorans]|uniref:DUF4145 domain-containing protein n=1 Tax=Candidatus Argoarchaeum ethanivorans TaxID=2608793 RepID=A0A811TI52_9EURY|nr:MAG: hypothetical protein LAKADJCE_00787 [Candidatus Argoarchaeum ethanivorans]
MVDCERITGFGSNSSPLDKIVLETEKDLICPFCHKSIEMQPLVYVNFEEYNNQILLKCKSCKNSFIGDTTRNNNTGNFNIIKLSKGTHKTSEFSKEIIDLSSTFVKIYGEAEFAEQENLMEICGVGYRKALEFLIKDYLISIKPDEEENIKNRFLGRCIKEDIEYTKIKQIAEKATWLGNDETHYIKKWEDKDLGDLKKLINITVHYILMELQAKTYLSDMEDNKKK